MVAPLGARPVASLDESARSTFIIRVYQHLLAAIIAFVAFEATAVSRYNGLTLELNRRFAGNTQFRLAYTLGKVVDTVPDATAVVPGNPGDDVKYA